jgi:hypothetical protein
MWIVVRNPEKAILFLKFFLGGGGAFWHVTFFVDEKPMCLEATVTILGEC